MNCLIHTPSALNDKTDLLTLCKEQYEGNEDELKILEEFEQNYLPSRAIWWYTRQSFLYRLLNKALQIQNMEILLLFRFFIRDIERQLEKNKCTSPIHAYAGQIMSNEDLQLFKDNLGGCLIINSFLFTSTKPQIQKYFSLIESSDECQRVLFDIEANPQLPKIRPFANIKTQSFFPNDDQTIFMLGSCFRINSVRQENGGVWSIKLELCSQNDPELKPIDDLRSFGETFLRFKKI